MVEDPALLLAKYFALQIFLQCTKIIVWGNDITFLWVAELFFGQRGERRVSPLLCCKTQTECDTGRVQ